MDAVAVILVVEEVAAAAVTTIGAAQVAPEDSRRWKTGLGEERFRGDPQAEYTPQQTLPCSQGIAAASTLQTSDQTWQPANIIATYTLRHLAYHTLHIFVHPFSPSQSKVRAGNSTFRPLTGQCRPNRPACRALLCK